MLDLFGLKRRVVRLREPAEPGLGEDDEAVGVRLLPVA